MPASRMLPYGVLVPRLQGSLSQGNHCGNGVDEAREACKTICLVGDLSGAEKGKDSDRERI
jgi:hypothetical protein